jgi:hypothetical protein
MKTVNQWFDKGELVREEEVDIQLPPLGDAGVLATLLAVKGILTTKDAARSVQRSEADLVAEAQAWAVAAALNTTR